MSAGTPDRSIACSEENPCSCRRVSGTFTNSFLTGEACAPLSPLQQCTQGRLAGDLETQYDFFFSTQVPLPNAPQTFRFTGVSRITGERGTMQSEDFGRINFREDNTAPFITFVEITGGTGEFAGATGSLQALGVVDLLTSEGSGTYDGQICIPRPKPLPQAALSPQDETAEPADSPGVE